MEMSFQYLILLTQVDIQYLDTYQSSTNIDGASGVSTYELNNNVYAVVTAQIGDEFSTI